MNFSTEKSIESYGFFELIGSIESTGFKEFVEFIEQLGCVS
jgi:hypothetical protein